MSQPPPTLKEMLQILQVIFNLEHKFITVLLLCLSFRLALTLHLGLALVYCRNVYNSKSLTERPAIQLVKVPNLLIIFILVFVTRMTPCID